MGMRRQSTSSLGIYVHIPFCLRKCDYCDFFSVSSARGDVPHEEYLRALAGQLRRDAAAHDLEGASVATVYFGGGTPSLMPPVFFEGILSEIGRVFSLDPGAEISSEVNPATVDGRWFREVRKAGISRVSIGVQSFNPALLESLGRIHSPEDAMRAIAEAQEGGFEGAGVDLMYAIPGETMHDLEDDVRTAMAFQPGHISAYQLTIEEGTPLATRCVRQLPEDDQLKQMRTVARMLSRGGWNRYEISNFARPGLECGHNLNYWRYGEYLGLGAGAASFVFAELPFFAKRFTQIRDVARYMAGTSELVEAEDIDPRTAMGEFCFLGLRASEGISAEAFEKLFGVQLESVFGAPLEKLVAEKLLLKDSNRFSLTQRGVELSNQVFENFV
ncbi:MAG: radical SAM family heme chaperone HemW [Pseudomonadota bacterium]